MDRYDCFKIPDEVKETTIEVKKPTCTNQEALTGKTRYNTFKMQSYKNNKTSFFCSGKLITLVT